MDTWLLNSKSCSEKQPSNIMSSRIILVYVRVNIFQFLSVSWVLDSQTRFSVIRPLRNFRARGHSVLLGSKCSPTFTQGVIFGCELTLWVPSALEQHSACPLGQWPTVGRSTTFKPTKHGRCGKSSTAMSVSNLRCSSDFDSHSPLTAERR